LVFAVAVASAVALALAFLAVIPTLERSEGGGTCCLPFLPLLFSQLGDEQVPRGFNLGSHKPTEYPALAAGGTLFASHRTRPLTREASLNPKPVKPPPPQNSPQPNENKPDNKLKKLA
jgi:hypothetical protein